MVNMDLDNDVMMAGPSKSIEGKENKSLPLHRVRFVDWEPSSISALAFLPLNEKVQSYSSTARSILAVGRDNGNIDLCIWIEDDSINVSSDLDTLKQNGSQRLNAPVSVAKGWVVDTTLVGSSSTKVDSIAFVLSPSEPYPTPRLFSSSGGAIVTEHFLPPHIIMAYRNSTSSSFQELPTSVQKSSNLTNSSRSITTQGGSVWSMAASPLGKHLAIGCEDGVVRMIDIEDGRFEMARHTRSSMRGADGISRGNASMLDRAKGRIVSLAWGPPQKRARQTINVNKKQASSDSDSESSSDDDEDEWDDTFVLGGTAQSNAYIWSANTGQIITKLVVDRTRNQQTIVWSCATLLDGTCILGDSLGQVSFYDGKMFTLLPGARFKSHGKGADVLSLCVGTGGDCVYSASVDQKVVEYTRVGVGKEMRWTTSGRRRLHAHDIRALAIDPPYDPKALLSSSVSSITRLPILVSGGVDFHLTLTPASPPSGTTLINSRQAKDNTNVKNTTKQSKFDHINPISTTAVTTFADTIHRRIPFVPTSGKGSSLGGGSVVRVCAAKRWVVLRRDNSVAIWKLPAVATDEVDETIEAEKQKQDGWKMLLEMQIKVQSNLVCVEISNDGRYLFVSDLYESKLFEIYESEENIIPQRIKSFSSKTFISQGLHQAPACSAATFTPDDQRLIIASYPGAFLHVIELSKTINSTKCNLLKSFADHRQSTFGRAIAGKIANGFNGNGINGHNSSDSDGNSSGSEDDEITGPTAPGPRTTFARIDTVRVSSDGQYLVSIDAAKRIHCYSLDTLHHRGALPSPAQQPNAITFDPWQPHRMCCILPTNQVVVYDLERKQATLSNQNSQIAISSTTSSEEDKKTLKARKKMRHKGEKGYISALNESLATVRDNAIGIFWISPKILVVWGATFLCTAKEVEMKDEEVEEQSNSVTRNGKRAHPDQSTDNTKEDQHQDMHNYWRAKLLTKYQPLLHAGTVVNPSSSEIELVVVERPYYDVANSLPPSYFGGASYGT